MFQNRKLNLFLLKNTSMVCFAFLLFLVLMIGLIGQNSLAEEFGSQTAYSSEDVSAIYDSGKRNVEMTFPMLHQIGYDCYINDTKIGSYYYAWMDGQFVIVLIDSEQSVLEDYHVQGRIMEMSTTFDYIWMQCAESMRMTSEQLDDLTYTYIISEPDAHKIFRYVVRLTVGIALLLLLLSILELAVCLFVPWMHPQIRRIKGIQNRRLFVGDVNRQLHDALLYEHQNCYMTKKYLVISSVLRTDIIALEDIDVMSKHRDIKRSVPWKEESIRYRLIISDTTGSIYEHNFKDEIVLNKVEAWLKENQDVS